MIFSLQLNQDELEALDRLLYGAFCGAWWTIEDEETLTHLRLLIETLASPGRKEPLHRNPNKSE